MQEPQYRGGQREPQETAGGHRAPHRITGKQQQHEGEEDEQELQQAVTGSSSMRRMTSSSSRSGRRSDVKRSRTKFSSVDN